MNFRSISERLCFSHRGISPNEALLARVSMSFFCLLWSKEDTATLVIGYGNANRQRLQIYKHKNVITTGTDKANTIRLLDPEEHSPGETEEP